MQNPLNQSPLAFPLLECLHILGFIVGVGTIALVNFRLLGIGLVRRSSARTGPEAPLCGPVSSSTQLWSDMWPWTVAGLTLVVFSGSLLFSINPDVYSLNYTFLFKMSCLVLAILLHFTLVRRAALAGRGAIAACVSLLLWILVLTAGVFIGLSASRPPAAATPPAGVNFDQFLNQ